MINQITDFLDKLNEEDLGKVIDITEDFLKIFQRNIALIGSDECQLITLRSVMKKINDHAFIRYENEYTE